MKFVQYRSVSLTARRRTALLCGLAVGLALASCDDSDEVDTAHRFQLTRSAEGIAQIEAPTLAAASAGLGYAYAQDNFCLLQDYLLTVNGERSKYLGPDATVLTQVAHVNSKNLASDFFYRFYVDGAQADRLYAAADAQSNELIAGYVAGVNRYLAETPAASIDAACRGKPWLRAMTLTDAHKILVDKAILSSGANFIEPLVSTQPPAATPASTPATPTAAAVDLALLGLPAVPLASNGWAFGRDRVEGGGSLLFGNPHLPWLTTNRFYQARMRVAGSYEVTGAALGGVPVLSIGYNRNLAWSHTISTAKRFTLYELALKSGDPLTYVVDGIEKPMTPVDVTVEVLAGGSVAPQTRRFYRTDFGPVMSLASAGLGWSAQRAYTLADVNLANNRGVATWLQLGQATTVRQAQAVLSANLGLPWVNTIASDSTGEVMYADITAVPNVEAADLTRCAPSARAAALLGAAGLVVLNGGTAQCRWTADPSTPVPGLMPASRLPSVIRTDFVANSNDSFWLANPAVTWPAYSPLLGSVGTPQRPRTRAALTTIERRFAGTDGLPGRLMSADAVQTLWYRSENYMAGVVLGDLLALCPANPTVTLSGGSTVSTTAACAALTAWDRRSSADSRGAHVFREFWRSASAIPNVYATAFNPGNPLNTPSGLNTGDATVRAAILQSFGNAIALFQGAGVAMDATLGSLQYLTVNGTRIPFSAGEEFEGVPNKQETFGFVNGAYQPLLGSSYVQLVDFGKGSPPSARGVLTYSQSTDAASPWFGNQLKTYSDKQFYTLPAP